VNSEQRKEAFAKSGMLNLKSIFLTGMKGIKGMGRAKIQNLSAYVNAFGPTPADKDSRFQITPFLWPLGFGLWA